jgi:hypothetical protein
MIEPAAISNRFDLAALDALLGHRGYVAALERHPSTGQVHYATLSRDNFDNGARARVTASYALGFPGRGRRLFNLLTLDLQIQDGVATVICVRRLGRLVEKASLIESLMVLARPLAEARLPNRAMLAPFLPPALLDILEHDLSAADFPDDGVDQEEKLPEMLWDQPPVLHGDKIDSGALAITLNLAVGERAELADVNPVNGDYRVFHLSIAHTPSGGENLTFELYRQANGPKHLAFNVLSLTIGRPDILGLSPVEAFSCNAGTSVTELPQLLPLLAKIVSALQERKRPDDTLLLTLLSKPAQNLWTKALVEGGVV